MPSFEFGVVENADSSCDRLVQPHQRGARLVVRNELADGFLLRCERNSDWVAVIRYIRAGDAWVYCFAGDYTAWTRDMSDGCNSVRVTGPHVDEIATGQVEEFSIQQWGNQIDVRIEVPSGYEREDVGEQDTRTGRPRTIRWAKNPRSGQTNWPSISVSIDDHPTTGEDTGTKPGDRSTQIWRRVALGPKWSIECFITVRGAIPQQIEQAARICKTMKASASK